MHLQNGDCLSLSAVRYHPSTDLSRIRVPDRAEAHSKHRRWNGRLRPFLDIQATRLNGKCWPKGERRLSTVGMPERTFTPALPNGSTRPKAVLQRPGQISRNDQQRHLVKPFARHRTRESPMGDRRCHVGARSTAPSAPSECTARPATSVVASAR